jgi:hypothetical protein
MAATEARRAPCTTPRRCTRRAAARPAERLRPSAPRGQMCERFRIGEADFYLWLDYTSIPQCNKTMQRLSIDSLPIYASVTRFFVCVCPTTQHDGSHLEVDPTTYQRRGWCRLEQLARITVGGLENMYMYDGQLKQARPTRIVIHHRHSPPPPPPQPASRQQQQSTTTSSRTTTTVPVVARLS